MTTDALEQRFLKHFVALGGPADEAEVEWRALAERYREPHRAYHNLEHIRAMLAHLDAYRDALQDPLRVEAAIWYHDVIYDTHASDNEAASARFATEHLTFLSDEHARRVHDLIMATCHGAHAGPEDDDAALLIDIDLSILGASPSAFDAYDAAIRAEYAWVPEPLYASGRTKVLRGFLERDAIYTTDAFFEAREEQARANLQRALDALSP